MTMKKKVFAVIFCVALGISVCAFANDYHEERYVRSMAAEKNIKLISVEEAERIAQERLNSRNVRFTEMELEDEADDYPNAINFRPVYKLECVHEGREYDIEIDAVTGKILKFKLDD